MSSDAGSTPFPFFHGRWDFHVICGTKRWGNHDVFDACVLWAKFTLVQWIRRWFLGRGWLYFTLGWSENGLGWEENSANAGLHPGELFERYYAVLKYRWEPQEYTNFSIIDHSMRWFTKELFLCGVQMCDIAPDWNDHHKLGKHSWLQRVKGAASMAELIIHTKQG